VVIQCTPVEANMTEFVGQLSPGPLAETFEGVVEMENQTQLRVPLDDRLDFRLDRRCAILEMLRHWDAITSMYRREHQAH
jgi:hypothetical protein